MRVQKMAPEQRAKQHRIKAENEVRVSRSICRSGMILFACFYGMAGFVPVFLDDAGGSGYHFPTYYAVVPLSLAFIQVGLFYLAKRKTTVALLGSLAIAVAVWIGLIVLRKLATGAWDTVRNVLVRTADGGIVLMLFFFAIGVYSLLRFRKHQRRQQALLRQHVERGWFKSERGG